MASIDPFGGYGASDARPVTIALFFVAATRFGRASIWSRFKVWRYFSMALLLDGAEKVLLR